MPMVINFVYCDQVDVVEGKLTIGGPLNFINPRFVPGMFSFTVAFGIVGLNTQQRNDLQLKFFDVNDDEIMSTGILTIPENADIDPNLPMEVRGFMANMEFKNVVFKSEGAYKTELYLNGERLGQYPIIVKGVEGNE
ncbi:DUF6941 family protein [Bacillus paranthracis]|uniref:DUF6941 family protein n=1 Tax=Bacillus paranthracis TaxID=2026186 RepID=UPI003D1E1F96